MSNWLQQFRILFPEATEKYTSKIQRLEEVENAVSNVYSTLRLRTEILRIIEESEAWNYPWFWPKMSNITELDLCVPADLAIRKNQHDFIIALYDLIRHIEVVSVILRFLCPDEFGIISPPVLSFLHLSPLADSVEYYEKYLDVLRNLTNKYDLGRVADADMAIWSASHLYLDPSYAAIVEEMRADEYFQRMLFENMISGWSSLTRQTKIHHLQFAEAFLKHDYLLSSIITARIYEEAIWVLSKKWAVKPGARKKDQSTTSALIDKLKCKKRKLEAIEINPMDLDTWWGWRNDSVHTENQITKKNAIEFFHGVKNFYINVIKIKCD